MWIKAQTLWDTTQTVSGFDSAAAIKQIAALLSESEWRLQNVLKNPSQNEADRRKIAEGKEIKLPQCPQPVLLGTQVADISLKIATAFNLNEMEAVDLVLTAEIQQGNFSGLGLGLVSVVLYYDAQRMIATTLRSILEWLRLEDFPEQLRAQIKKSFVTRRLLEHLVDQQNTFNVHNELHTLATKHQGLGNAFHQSLLRSLIEESRQQLSESIYLMTGSPELMTQVLPVLLPTLKKLQPGERFANVHLVVWTAIHSMIGPVSIQKNPIECAAVLKVLLEEVRNETNWGDLALCGSMQLSVAVAVRQLQLSPPDHSVTLAFPQDMQFLAGRAVISNLAFKFIRFCIIRHDIFRSSATQVQLADTLLKAFVALFPPKLMEVVRLSEDELTMLDECTARGISTSEPQAPFEHLLRGMTELYDCKSDETSEEFHTYDPKSFLDELSSQFSVDESQKLVQFCEMATRPQHAAHSVAFLDMLRSVCRTQGTARTLFDVFYQIGVNDDGWVGWEQVINALRAYERLFRDELSMEGRDGYRVANGKNQQRMEKAMHSYELAGLVSWLGLATQIAMLDDEASCVICEERGWNVIELSCSLITAPIPLALKGCLLRFLGALGRRKMTAPRVWTALCTYGVCEMDERGQLTGVQRELEEMECREKDYPCTLGTVVMLNCLMEQPIPQSAQPLLVFLSKSVVASLALRSYNDVRQMWELASTSLTALHKLVLQTHADSVSVSRRLPQVNILVQLLNDSPLLRSVMTLLSEDVCVSLQTHCTRRPSTETALVALKLLHSATQRLAPLRSAIRAADCDALLATLESIFFSPFGQTQRGCLLTHIFHYLSKAVEQPVHALHAAGLLRELSAVRPCLQPRIVHLLRVNHELHSSMIRSVRRLLTVDGSAVRYSVEDVNYIYSSVEGLNENDLGMVQGETARLVLEIMAEGAEECASQENLAAFLLGFDHNAPAEDALYPNDSSRTAIHSLIDLMEVIISSPDPFSLSSSALFEPSFRLLLRLMSHDSPRRLAIMRHLRTTKIVYRLLTSPFVKEQAFLLMDETRMEQSPTIAAVSSMLTGYVLHMCALELSHLLSVGQLDLPQQFYVALLESGGSIEDGGEGDTNEGMVMMGEEGSLLFALLRHARRLGSLLPDAPLFACFDALKVQNLLNMCRGSAVFEVEQYDVGHVHWLLQREILSLNVEDAQQPTREMERILEFVVSLNGALLSSGASSVLLAGSCALVNVLALYSPVAFFAHQPQLDSLLDACFTLIEVASSNEVDVSEMVSSTLLRVSKAVCLLSRLVCSSPSDRRALLSKVLLPLLELLVQPSERSIAVKMSVYGAVAACLRECAMAAGEEEKRREKEEEGKEAEVGWLLQPLHLKSTDPVRIAVENLSRELIGCVTGDIMDLPPQHIVLPLRVLQCLVEEDSKGGRTLCDGLARDGRPRALLEMTLSIGDENGGRRTLDALLCLLSHMALSSDSCWRSLADLAAPELLMHIPSLRNAPKELFLDPTSLKKENTQASLYGHTLYLILGMCMALTSNVSWKTLSLQVVALLNSLSDLLSQLMRAEVDCDALIVARKLTAFIYKHDDVARSSIDSSRTLTALRQEEEAKKEQQKPKRQPLSSSFVTPSRLFSL